MAEAIESLVGAFIILQIGLTTPNHLPQLIGVILCGILPRWSHSSTVAVEPTNAAKLRRVLR